VNKRLIIKTTLICTGIYIILAAIAVFVLNLNYQLDTEKRINVIVATNDILPGEVIKDSMVESRSIRESDFSPNMLIQPVQCNNSKTSVPVKSGDYIFSYNLISPGKWQSEDARTIVLPMTIDERLANLIKKGSIINIKVLPEGRKTIPKLVLSRITVSDMLDENGLPIGDAIGNKKAYAVVTLNDMQRNRLYAAMQDGKLMYELFCDLTQPKEDEDYTIPSEFFDESYPARNMEQETNSNIKTDGGEN
jgi:hypothetical protein